jgi:hypothetical protein
VIVIEAEGALRCDFVLDEKVRNANDEDPVGRVPQNKTHM